MKKVNVSFALIILAISILLISNVHAATINAASCSQANVQSAMNSALNGDIVIVPPGSCSWTGLTISKKITLQGAGSSSTYISGGNITMTNIAARITGFNFTGTTISINETTAGTSNGWRIDHNTFTWSGSSVTIPIHGNVTGSINTHPTGVIDHNYFTDGQISIFGDMATGASNGDKLWNLSEPMGSGTNIVYIEDNTFYSASFLDYAIDGNYGARYVVRYNTFTNRAFEHHGIQSSQNRGVSSWEIYNNTFTTSSPYWAGLYIRSGGGLIFNNTMTNFTNGIIFDNQTSCRYGDGGIACDGTNARDGNRPGMQGYPCRDQIGRRRDTVLGHTGDTQILSPMYTWNNKIGGREIAATMIADVDCPRNSLHIVIDRDYYRGASGVQTSATSPFNGTTGVGYGTLANRPTTCTTNANESGGGVAYWATDTDTLYRCSSTNIWTVHYRPYTYPHPLTTGTTLPPTTVKPSAITTLQFL